MRTLIALLAVVLLFCGCAQDDDSQGRENRSTSSFPETTTTSTTMTLDTTTTPYSTTSSTTTSSLVTNASFTQACFPEEDNPFTCRNSGGDPYCGSGWCKCACPDDANTTERIDFECDKYCRMIGYNSGSCEANMFECQVRRMVKTHYVDVLCIDARRNVCCCETNKTIPKYSQLLNNAGRGGSGLTFQEK
jgi:hypothetical protein